MKKFHAGKNDIFFACVVVAMFAVTVVGVIAAGLDFARDRVEANYAKTRVGPVALRATEQEPKVARAGPVR